MSLFAEPAFRPSRRIFLFHQSRKVQASSGVISED